jgi:glucosamine-6-phosphate deaminase
MRVQVHGTRLQLGAAAAAAVAAEIRSLIAERGRAVGIFAAAPSQIETLTALVQAQGIDWQRVTAFHLDEYLGFEETRTQSFRCFLRQHLLSEVAIGTFYGIRGEASDPAAECARYAALLRADPPDFALLGIGENGHLAFNDPLVADFDDPLLVKVVTLEDACRRQQVHDGAFAALHDVPQRAITVTIPAIVRVPKLLLAVPGARKRKAVQAALQGPLTPACPASILRNHPEAHLFLDQDSGVETHLDAVVY